MSLKIEVDVSEVERLAKRSPEAEQAVIKSMLNPMRRSLQRLRIEVQAYTPVGVTGNLRDGIETNINGRPPNFSGDVLPNVLYGDPVEFGRKPGKFPPPDAIELWVRRVLDVPSEDVRGVAFVIARAIARRGIPPVRMFERGLSRGFPAVERIWEAWVKEAANLAARVLDK